MGREIRRVPADWEHPKVKEGHFQPLYDESYEKACKEWYAGCLKNNGRYTDDDGETCWYHEYEGNPPDETYYRKRDWTPEEATHIQMYETVSEGTPVSPVCATKEVLVDYLCQYGDYWDQRRRKEGTSGMPCAPWTRKNAEHFVNSGWACSGIITGGKIYGPSEQGELSQESAQG